MTRQRSKAQPKTTSTKDGPPAGARVPAINLRTKYYSVVPLHLLFIHFTLYYLPGKILSSPEDGRPGTASSLEHLVRHPIRSLAIINLGVLLVQLWFSNFLRSWKSSLAGPAPETPSEKHRPLPKKRMLASQLKTLLLSLIHAPPSEFPKRLAKELDPKLRSLISRSTLLLKEALLINTIILLAITALLVLLGASTFSLSQLLKNLGLACFLGLLSFFPASLLLGWNQAREKPNWIRIFSTFQPKNEIEVAILFPAIGACVGTWLGAIPIPLDWDQPWQAWPITCLVGASGGHAVGSVVSIIHSALYASS
ncbi:hypothetical protein PtA15_5A255 [Puccinia triticina]|uniref:Glycosylphosphatidylinositol anchor biosynthesis protein 11 n=1 Tax=Puccinia triticina TaxID=208348 RepID=A0ABY7CJL8_9BASI|nr:uncharacterized protein PtA15_5A255 [Puccinia triticina]WAQ84682.1 hypothetical protein PtA15_5A255 [Puccinia triticina]WAR58027.1 hypothetical protein PtB15_5B258 [Puccinia triticina]